VYSEEEKSTIDSLSMKSYSSSHSADKSMAKKRKQKPALVKGRNKNLSTLMEEVSEFDCDKDSSSSSKKDQSSKGP
jgi:hypothetical protein